MLALAPTARPAPRLARAALACLLVGGCDRLEAAIQERVQEEKAELDAEAAVGLPVPTSGAQTDEERVAVKLNLYVECTNRSRDRIRESWARYAERVDAKTGTPRAKQKPFVYRIDGELEPCKQALEQGPKLEPPMPEIEAALAEYHGRGLEVAGYTQQLDEYYQRETYKEDAWAKGKEIAPAFQTAYEAWDAADLVLENAVDKRKDENDVKLLALIEQREGKNLRWHAQRVVLSAKALARCVADVANKAADCEDEHAAMVTAEQEFRSYHDAHAAEAEAVFWMSSFQGAAAAYGTEAAALMRALGHGKVKADDRQRATDRYNDLVHAANNLRFDMP